MKQVDSSVAGGVSSRSNSGLVSQHADVSGANYLHENKNDQQVTALSVVPDPVESRQVATTFHDDAQVTVSKRADIIDTTRMMSALDLGNLSIVDFLSRPLEIFAGNLTQSLTKGFTLFNSTWESFFTHMVMLRQKLTYFRFIRANLHVKVVMNTPPTSTGRLWLFFSPWDDRRAARGFRSYMMNNTGYPGVEVDAGSGQTSELEIPYWSPMSHADIMRKRSTVSLGRVVLRVLTPYRTANSADTGSFSIYSWFSDIHFSGLTDNQTIFGVAQCDDKGSSGKIVSREGRKSIASTAAWVADKAIDFLGLSKPIDERAVSAMIQIPARGFTQGNGVDTSVSLSVLPDNGISMSESKGPTKEDEMAIGHIVKRSNYVESFTWSTAQLDGALLFTMPVTPTYSGEQDVVTSDILLSHLGFVANTAEYWRGPLIIRLSVVSNSFYSGRLGIVFLPGLSPSEVTTTTNFQAGIRDIVDVRTSNEFTRKVDYLSNTPYMRVALHRDPNDFTLDECTGTFAVYVVNALRTTSVVSDTLSVNVWLSSDDDFEVANFRFPRATISGFGQSNSAVEAFGEKVVNFRQLSRRFSDAVILNNAASFSIDARNFGGLTGWTEGTILHYMSFMYAGYSGSKRYKLYITETPTVNTARSEHFLCVYVGQPVSNTGASYLIQDPPSEAEKGMFQHVTKYTDFTPFSEVQIPYYGTVPFSIIGGSSSIPEDYAGRVFFEPEMDTISGNDGHYRLLSAAGDDFSFWYLIGVPPIIPS